MCEHLILEMLKTIESEQRRHEEGRWKMKLTRLELEMKTHFERMKNK